MFWRPGAQEFRRDSEWKVLAHGRKISGQRARGRERYARRAYRKRDDEAQMRKHVDPNWKRVLPRW